MSLSCLLPMHCHRKFQQIHVLIIKNFQSRFLLQKCLKYLANQCEACPQSELTRFGDSISRLYGPFTAVSIILFFLLFRLYNRFAFPFTLSLFLVLPLFRLEPPTTTTTFSKSIIQALTTVKNRQNRKREKGRNREIQFRRLEYVAEKKKER